MIYSQFPRCKRICTRNTDFIEHSKKLTTHLLQKTCSIKVITKQWNRVTLKTNAASIEELHALVHTYHPTIVPTNKAVVKEWKRYSNMPAANHLFSSTTLCACRQPQNFKQMLVMTRISTTPTFTGKKSMKARRQVCDIIETRPSLKISGTTTAIHPMPSI